MTTIDHPTPYADVNAVLGRFLSSVRIILAHRFVGMYLHGSLATGDFALDRSDIDFLVVTDRDLPDDIVLALREMHARLAREDSKWVRELEGSYIPLAALRRYDPRYARYPYIDRGSDTLAFEEHDSNEVVHRHVLRQHGVVLAGPALETLIDPIFSRELRRAVLEVLHGWWAPVDACRARLENPFYRCYAILTMCRMLYTLHHGVVVSKPVAARWAEGMLDDRWAGLIRDALAWSREAPPDLNETLELILYTRERSRQLKAP